MITHGPDTSTKSDGDMEDWNTRKYLHLIDAKPSDDILNALPCYAMGVPMRERHIVDNDGLADSWARNQEWAFALFEDMYALSAG